MKGPTLLRSILILTLAGQFAPVGAEPGTTSAQFLNLGPDARILALGGCGTACAAGVSALYWNPACLGWFEGTEAGFTHVEHFLSIRGEDAGMATARGGLGLGFSVHGVYLSGLEERTGPSASPIRTYGAYFLAPAVSVGRTIGRLLALGTSARIVYQTIGQDNALSFAGDAGISFRPGPASPLRLGAVLANLGTGVRYGSESYPLPTRIRAGAGLSFLRDRLRTAIDVVKPFRDDLRVGAGAEACLTERILLRAGYQSGPHANGGLAGLSLGAGFRSGNLNLDYALAGYGILGLSHHFSLAYEFGRNRRTLSDEERRIQEELERRSRITAQTFYQQGLARERESRFEDALYNYDLALVWFPGLDEARLASEAVKKTIRDRLSTEHITRGIAEYKSGNYVEAAAEFGAALDADSTSVIARNWLRTTTDAMVKIQMASIKLEQEKKDRIGLYLQNGLNYFSRQDYSRAIAEWTRVLELNPGNREAQAYITQARDKIRARIETQLASVETYILGEDWRRAYDELNRILALEPKQAQALARREEVKKKLRYLSADHTRAGIALYKESKFGLAQTEFKLALEYDATNVTAQEYIRQLASQSRDVSDEKVSDLYMKGVNAYTEEKYQTAVFYWKRVLELDPGHENARRNIARAEEKLKVYKK